MNQKIFKCLHFFIIANFLFEILYCTYLVFVVLKPEGAGVGPLMGSAMNMDPDLFLKRRLYAIECWIATSGLSIYLALTSFRSYLPERKALSS